MQATLGCSTPGSGLPVPMGLLGHPSSVPPDRPNLADPLHLANPLDLGPDSDLVLDSNSVVPLPNQTTLQAPLPNQSHHREEGEAEEGICHRVADRPWPAEMLGVMELEEGSELKRQRRAMNLRGR
jgi:hypothetical protein